MPETETGTALAGLRVLELGQLVAGPFAGTMLAYFGAEVIRVEAPGEGDPVRGWRVVEDGTSMWWYTLARNKRCAAIDLRLEEGRELVRRLALSADVLLENFRPGTLERWGLAPQDLWPQNPGLVFARVSGYGQTGPLSSQPGYASVCEAFGGLRYVTGEPGEPTVRANLSLADSICGLHAAFGILLALRERDHSGRGQVVDLALFESVFNLLEAAVPEYDRTGAVREPSGSGITGVVPSNTYACADGRDVVIGANGLTLYRRLMERAGRPDLASDPRLQTNEGRVAHQELIDQAIGSWTRTLPVAEVVEALRAESVPCGPIQSVADLFDDAHCRARGLFEEVTAGGRPLAVPAIPPKLSRTPGETRWGGPRLGEHTDEVLAELGLDRGEIEALREQGVVQ